jgi:hypothetical protein
MKYIYLSIIILAALAGVFFWGRSSVAPPKVSVGKTVITDTVIMHDTIVTQTSREQIQVIKKVLPADTVIIARLDSVTQTTGDTVRPEDTAVCYTIAQQYASGASASAELCSRFFLPTKPVDLQGTITYKPANDTNKIFTRIDTMQIIKKQRVASWYMLGLGVAAGIAAALLIHNL